MQLTHDNLALPTGQVSQSLACFQQSAEEHLNIEGKGLGIFFTTPPPVEPHLCSHISRNQSTYPPNSSNTNMADELHGKDLFTSTCENFSMADFRVKKNGQAVAKLKNHHFHTGGSITVTATDAKFVFTVNQGKRNSPPSMRVVTYPNDRIRDDVGQLYASARLNGTPEYGFHISLELGKQVFKISRLPTRVPTFQVHEVTTSAVESHKGTAYGRSQTSCASRSARELQCVGLMRVHKHSVLKDSYELFFLDDVDEILPTLCLLMIRTWRWR